MKYTVGLSGYGNRWTAMLLAVVSGFRSIRQGYKATVYDVQFIINYKAKIPSLNRTITSEDGNDTSISISDQLHFDMASILETFHEEDRRVGHFGLRMVTVN